MKELAEALKAKAGLRMRQGVVSAVDGSTVSVLIGGSTVAVEGVHHLNSVAPQVGEVVWIASDGADLWILGTHGDPPPIELSRLPAFETYFTDADPDGAPAPVTGLTGATTRAGVLLSWDLPPEARWRRWEVYEGTAADFVPVTPILTTTVTVVAIPRDPGSGPWYYKVRALNTRDEASTDVQAGPFSVALIGEANLAADCVTAAKIRAGEITAAKLDVTNVQAAVVTAAAVNALELNAGAIKAGTLSVDRIAAGSIKAAKLDVTNVQAAVVTAAAINAVTIDAVKITGGTITGAVLRTATSGARIEIDSDEAQQIQLFSGDSDEQLPGLIASDVDELAGGFISIRSPQIGVGAAISSLTLDKDSADITARKGTDFVQLSVGSAAKTVKIFGNLEVTGKVNPATNFSSGTSADGIWIQEGSAASTGWSKAGRWKIYYDPVNKRLYVRKDASNYAYFARAGGS